MYDFRETQMRTYLMVERTRGSDGISGLPSISLNRRLRSPIEEASRETCVNSLGIAIARILLLTSDKQNRELPSMR